MRMAASTFLSSIAAITVFAVLFCGLGAISPQTAAAGDLSIVFDIFPHILGMAMILFIGPVILIAATTGSVLVRRARRAGRMAVCPFLWWGALEGIVVVGVGWFALVGTALTVFDVLMIPTGAVVGVTGGAVFWLTSRGAGFVRDAA
jgi:hypothetical protein